MPKTSKRPTEINPQDVVIDHGVATGFTAKVGENQVAKEVDTLEEAEALVRAEIARQTYAEGHEPNIFVIDSEGMWEVSED